MESHAAPSPPAARSGAWPFAAAGGGAPWGLSWLTLLLCVAVLLPLLLLAFRALTKPSALTVAVCPPQATNTVYPYAAAEATGHRPYMEDRHVMAGELGGLPHVSFYAVFDGHGGDKAADYCVAHMVANLVRERSFDTRPAAALTAAFENTDAAFVARAKACRPPLDDGCTAVAALVVGDKLYVANAGDSRAVLLQRNGYVEALSEDHKPNRPDEAARIRSLGGIILFHGVWRVGGVLAVSRAVGDRTLKPWVTARPDIRKWTVGPADRYLILASDGLWDVITNADLGVLVKSDDAPAAIAAALVQEALQRGSLDNVTALVVDLTAPRGGAAALAAAGAAAIAARSSAGDAPVAGGSPARQAGGAPAGQSNGPASAAAATTVAAPPPPSPLAPPPATAGVALPALHAPPAVSSDGGGSGRNVAPAAGSGAVGRGAAGSGAAGSGAAGSGAAGSGAAGSGAAGSGAAGSGAAGSGAAGSGAAGSGGRFRYATVVEGVIAGISSPHVKLVPRGVDGGGGSAPGGDGDGDGDGDGGGRGIAATADVSTAAPPPDGAVLIDDSAAATAGGAGAAGDGDDVASSSALARGGSGGGRRRRFA